jgi:putative membrane protein
MIDYDAKNWLRIVFTLRGSVLPSLLVRVTLAAGLGLLAWWAHANHSFALPTIAHTLIGVALGLLLVFRTNASYGRYVEARALLGRILDSSRDMSRQLATYVAPHPGLVETRREVVRLLGAFYRLVVQSVRDERELDKLGDRLTAPERERLEGVTGRAAVVLSWASARVVALVDAGHVPELRLRSFDNNFNVLMGALGGCERIRRTPVPFAYAQHIKVFVVLFCYTVPFAMVDVLGAYTPVAAAVLAFALFGIDEIGVEIEDPFGYDPNDLPMERIGDVIDGNTREVVSVGARE